MKKYLRLVGLILLLAVPLVLLFKDFTREVLVAEILYIVWRVRILFESLPQIPIWTLFLIVVLFVAVRSLIKHRQPSPTSREVTAERQGPVYALSRRIERSTTSAYFQWRLARDLRTLVLEVLVYQHRISSEQSEQFLDVGTLDAPPEVQAYLQTGLAPVYTLSAGLLARLWQRLSPSTWDAAVDPDLEQVVQFLETQLEVQHDHRSN